MPKVVLNMLFLHQTKDFHVSHQVDHDIVQHKRLLTLLEVMDISTVSRISKFGLNFKVQKSDSNF